MDQISESQKSPHISPSWASYGVSIVRICEKIDRVITAPHCTYLNLNLVSVTACWAASHVLPHLWVSSRHSLSPAIPKIAEDYHLFATPWESSSQKLNTLGISVLTHWLRDTLWTCYLLSTWKWISTEQYRASTGMWNPRRVESSLLSLDSTEPEGAQTLYAGMIGQYSEVPAGLDLNFWYYLSCWTGGYASSPVPHNAIPVLARSEKNSLFHWMVTRR